ncbi:hypothetical protein SISNIDRAFT_506627 [Sistotremastrum niveocremeum HHB9708]|uniref:Uncharacterized protein n=1 Tax=Sistotremastrum niveocremeum HHB9708 TaxID=1314777 RepID=A0A164V6Z4_9AGAM|nr:hypothetical protein SISNIDRAFT_506627 [Sistotremastrum niveocremeum HHB9708]
MAWHDRNKPHQTRTKLTSLAGWRRRSIEEPVSLTVTSNSSSVKSSSRQDCLSGRVKEQGKHMNQESGILRVDVKDQDSTEREASFWDRSTLLSGKTRDIDRNRNRNRNENGNYIIIESNRIESNRIGFKTQITCTQFSGYEGERLLELLNDAETRCEEENRRMSEVK